MESSAKQEFQPGGLVPSGPEHVVFHEPTVFIRMDADVQDAVRQLAAAQELISHLAAQDPEQLEQDRSEAWSGSGHRPSPDAMVVNFDRTTEK